MNYFKVLNIKENDDKLLTSIFIQIIIVPLGDRSLQVSYFCSGP